MTPSNSTTAPARGSRTAAGSARRSSASPSRGSGAPVGAPAHRRHERDLVARRDRLPGSAYSRLIATTHWRGRATRRARQPRAARRPWRRRAARARAGRCRRARAGQRRGARRRSRPQCSVGPSRTFHPKPGAVVSSETSREDPLGAMRICSWLGRKAALARSAPRRDRAGHDHAAECRGDRRARPVVPAPHRHQRRTGALRRPPGHRGRRPLARDRRDRRPRRSRRPPLLARQPVPQPRRRAGRPAARPRARRADARHLRRLPAHGPRVRAQRARLRGRRARRVRPGRLAVVPDAARLLAGRQGAADRARARHAGRRALRRHRGRRAALLLVRDQSRAPPGAGGRRAARGRRRRGRRLPRARAAGPPVLRGDAVRAADALDPAEPHPLVTGFLEAALVPSSRV